MPPKSSPKRVAYVLKRYPRFSETFIVNEILAHERAGLEIDIFALRPTIDTHFQPGIAQVRAPVTYLTDDHPRADAFWSCLRELSRESPAVWKHLGAAGRLSGTEVYQAARLAAEICRRGVDHIHAHFATMATSIARLASLFSGVPFTFTAHAKDIFHESVDPSDVEEKIVSAAGVVTVSDFNVHFLGAQFEESAHKLCRIYNGLDLNQFEFDKPCRRPPKIVAVGRLVEKKGFDDLIEACVLLRESGVEFQCEIIGAGECESLLRARIQELNLASCVELAGARPMNYVQTAIRQAAVMAVPCVTATTGDRDGLPMVLLEAMALGTPAVATSVTGIPEVIRNEDTGLLVPERRPHELAAALRRLLVEDDLRLSLACAARNVIEQEFDIDRNAARMRGFFAASQSVRTPSLSLAGVG